MNYAETLDFLFDRLPMFHRIGPAAYKNSLDNTLKMDAFFGHPHRNYKTIHVAGTNGKGSVSHMLAAVLQEAGYKTGLYTSPHLKDFRERIRVNGEMIGENEVVDWIEKYAVGEDLWDIEPSFFELTVAMAFDYFAQRQVDVAVIEVGLGGRLDSTNIITPEVSIITNISFDHIQLLGDTLAKIAREKAGIIKNKVPVVVGEFQEDTAVVFNDFAWQMNAPINFASKEYIAEYAMMAMDGRQIMNIRKNNQPAYFDLKLDLLGNCQMKNVPTVLKTIDILVERGWDIKRECIYSGLENAARTTGLMGRWQILDYNPLTICDTGHNEDGIKMVVEQIRNTAYNKLHFVLGMVADKNQDNVLKLLPIDAVYYFTRASIPRAMDENELAKKASAFGLEGNTYKTVTAALMAAKQSASTNDLVFIGGSTFVVAEILE